ncbi:centrosome-associated protein CEP250-like [Varroa destructor]|uniref:GRIP domain-containing protein n=1 Tax=Varroa destructor TaxID=109461 RepID=A0A7M7K5R9_VARDE|nr:centrosome-associated protein CEP250-like [Varroa destructor]XP_022660783.1 centrosome-associated protein CEP250-like [Varroa destructor]XP_022660784.1 centrosome-associated protein CEP250-like [Varroa destructor]
MTWFNQFNQITSHVQNFARDVFDQDGNYNSGQSSNQEGNSASAAETIESLRQEKTRLEDSLLQLDQQYQEEMSKVILIKDELQNKLKRAEGELEQYRKGVTPMAPAAVHEVSLDDWGDDWGDGGTPPVVFSARSSGDPSPLTAVGSSAAKLDETAHELLELRSSLEEAQRQLEAGQGIKLEFEKLKHENNTLKNRLEALEQENENLEAELEGIRSEEAVTSGGSVSSAKKYETFCKEVVSVLLGDAELSDEKLSEARVGLSDLSDKVQRFEHSTNTVVKNLELIADQKKTILTEKIALEDELRSLRNVNEELKTIQGQLKKATTDREAIAAKLEKAKTSEAMLIQQIAELNARERVADVSNHMEVQTEAEKRITLMKQQLECEQAAVQELQAELEKVRASAANSVEAIEHELTANKEALVELKQSLAESLSQLEVAAAREASLTQELQNIQVLLADLQKESISGHDEAAVLLKTTRQQESKILQLTGELQLLRVDESKHIQRAEELEKQVEALSQATLASVNSQEMDEEMANLRQRLETSEQELELLRHSRDSVVSELEAAKHELDMCQQKLVQIQMESGQGHSSTTEQITTYSKQLEAAESERQESANKLANAQRELEALQVVRQALEKGMQQLSTEKEQMIAVVSDKARENNDLKGRLDGLMSALANEKQLTIQLQQQLQQTQGEVQRLQQAPAEPQAATPLLTDKIAALEGEQQTLTRTIQHKGQENAELKQRIQKLLDNESRLNVDVQRLRAHLASEDERHTKEILAHEHRIASLQQKLSEFEANARYTDSSVQAVTAAASERVEILEAELETVSCQRDEALEELSQMEDRLQQSQTSLASLQVVLEQMQREADNQIRTAKKQYEAEQKRKNERILELEAAVAAKEETLSNVSETVQATQRLSEQLEQKNSDLSRLQQKLAESDDQLQAALSKCRKAEGAEGQVEKQLIKNMLLGYFTAPADKKNDVLRCITGYLEFSEGEARKTGLGSGQRGFLGIFGGGQQSTSSGNDPNDSFTNQFIAFLEKESMPNAPLKLPTELNATSHQDSRLRKVISSSLPPDQQLPRQMASSPYRHPPTDNPLFSHLPQQQSTVSSTGDTTSMVTWAPSLAGSSRESTASEPEMLRELLGQAPSSSLS